MIRWIIAAWVMALGCAGVLAQERAARQAASSAPSGTALPAGAVMQLGVGFPVGAGHAGELAISGGRLAISDLQPGGGVRICQLDPPAVIVDLLPRPRGSAEAITDAPTTQQQSRVLYPAPVSFGGESLIAIGTPGDRPAAITLYDLAQRRTLHVLEPAGEQTPLHHLALSCDGRWLITAAERIELWDAATGERLADLGQFAPTHGRLSRPQGQTGPAGPRQRTGLTISADGRRLLAVRPDGAVAVWDLETRNPLNLHAIEDFPGRVGDALLLADGRHLLVLPAQIGPDDPVLRLFDLDEQREKQVPQPTYGPRVGQDGRELIRWPRVYAVRAATRVPRVAVVEGLQTTVWEVTPDGAVQIKRTFPTPMPMQTYLSDDGAALFQVDMSRRINAWSVETGEAIVPPVPHRQPIHLVGVSLDRREIITGSTDGLARWDAASGRLLGRRGGIQPQGRDNALLDLFHGDEAQATIRQQHGNMRFVDPARLLDPSGVAAQHQADSQSRRPRPAPTREQPWTLPDFAGHVSIAPPNEAFPQQVWSNQLQRTLAISPDGRLTARTSAGGVHVWSADQRKEPLRVIPPHEQRAPQAVAFSADGRRLAVADLGGWQVYDCQTWEVVASGVPGEVGELLSIVFSPDGRSIACGSSVAVGLWEIDAAAPAEPRWVKRDGQVRLGAVFSTSGELLLVPGARGLEVIEVASGQLVTRLPVAGAGAASVCVLPDDRRIITGGMTGTAIVWDLVEALRPEQTPEGEWAEGEVPDEVLWERLGQSDPAIAYPAGVMLMARGRLGAAPATHVVEKATDADEPQHLVKLLSGPDLAERERAHKTLERLGLAAREAVIEGLAAAPAGSELQARLISLARLTGGVDLPPVAEEAGQVPDGPGPALLRARRLNQLRVWQEAGAVRAGKGPVDVAEEKEAVEP